MASEATPYAKTGGLADVVAGLAASLAGAGVQPLLILPLYREVPRDDLCDIGLRLSWSSPNGRVMARAWEGKSARAGFPIYFLDVPEHFDRTGLYGTGSRDYFDNLERFATFSRGALELLKALSLRPDWIHCHDWQTALVPLYLRTLFATDPFFRRTRSVLTIHNLAYQGDFDADRLRASGVGADCFTPAFLEFHGRINLLKGGLVTADLLTTVSPTYAREIQTPAYGCGLEDVLRYRSGDLFGILNGIDTSIWNPGTDPHLVTRYDARALRGKARCKEALQQEVGLPRDANAPLFGMVNRIVEQKGIDLVLDALPQLLETSRSQWVMLGEGDPRLETRLAELAGAHPRAVAFRAGFDESSAHRLIAGSDFVLMPSRFEPCGLNQMYGQRYGSLPVGRAVGGIADSVDDAGSSPNGDGTGFLFRGLSADSFVDALRRALDCYRRPRLRRAMLRNAMGRDFSWHRSTRRYRRLYDRLHRRPPRRPAVAHG